MSDHRFLVIGGSGFIGTHLVEKLTKRQAPVLNIDIVPPILSHHLELWSSCNIMSIDCMYEIIANFKPTHVFHLAAKATLRGQRIEDFSENTIGTDNVITCLNDIGNIERFIHFSTQYVVRPGVYPENEEFLLPYTFYGDSKAEAETIVRSKCDKCWVILRPTNVWGPFHPAFPHELWKYLKLGLYLHPGYQPIIKHYAFVTNAVDQIVAISLANAESVCGRVFYITDPPIDNAEWMNAFSVALTGKKVKRIPLRLWQILGKIGDAMIRLGLNFPMSSERLFRLTINEQIPYEATIEIAGFPRVAIDEGVLKSVRWYKRFLVGATEQWTL